MNEIKEIYDDYLKETIYFATHKSGLRIIFVPKKFTSYYALLGVRYGSVDSLFKCDGESDHIKVPDGIAHYLEHKMFENEDGSDAFAAFSKYGASANAFTTHNLTAYLFSCTSNFEESLSELIRFVRAPYFTEANVDKERGIISEEIEMYEDDPYSSLHYGMLDLLYENNPVKINIAGTVKTVSEITPAHLYRCYNAFYTLDNMVLSVSGDTDVNTILSVCDKLLPDDSVSCTVERGCVAEPDAVKEKRGVVYKPVSNPLFCIGLKDKIALESKERVKRSIAGAILMDVLFGSSSDYFSKLYSDGTISSMSCGYDSMINYAFGYIIGESVDCEKVYKEFMQTAERAVADGISASDFERIKKVTLSNFVKTFDSTESIATEALYMELEGVSIDKYASLIHEIDLEYVSILADELLSEEHVSMMTVLPSKTEEG